MKTGVDLITDERQRQITAEGWTPEHDAVHTDGSIAMAAACYALPDNERRKYQLSWPQSWGNNWWKPTPNDRVKELVKAGALIAAEIDRIRRTHINHWADKYKPPIFSEEHYNEANQHDTLAEWWQHCKQPMWMLWLLMRERYNDEKVLRTLALRWLRRVEHLLTEQGSKDALNVLERLINGEATNREVAEARKEAWFAACDATGIASDAGWAVMHSLYDQSGEVIWGLIESAEYAACAVGEQGHLSERAAQADIIRELIPASELEKLISKGEKQ